MAELLLPDVWLVADAWPIVREYLQWVPAPYSDRKQILLHWSLRARVKLTRYHYESIARPGEAMIDAGVA